MDLQSHGGAKDMLTLPIQEPLPERASSLRQHRPSMQSSTLPNPDLGDSAQLHPSTHANRVRRLRSVSYASEPLKGDISAPEQVEQSAPVLLKPPSGVSSGGGQPTAHARRGLLDSIVHAAALRNQKQAWPASSDAVPGLQSWQNLHSQKLHPPPTPNPTQHSQYQQQTHLTLPSPTFPSSLLSSPQRRHSRKPSSTHNITIPLDPLTTRLFEKTNIELGLDTDQQQQPPLSAESDSNSSPPTLRKRLSDLLSGPSREAEQQRRVLLARIRQAARERRGYIRDDTSDERSSDEERVVKEPGGKVRAIEETTATALTAPASPPSLLSPSSLLADPSPDNVLFFDSIKNDKADVQSLNPPGRLKQKFMSMLKKTKNRLRKSTDDSSSHLTGLAPSALDTTWRQEHASMIENVPAMWRKRPILTPSTHSSEHPSPHFGQFHPGLPMSSFEHASLAGDLISTADPAMSFISEVVPAAPQQSILTEPRPVKLKSKAKSPLFSSVMLVQELNLPPNSNDLPKSNNSSSRFSLSTATTRSFGQPLQSVKEASAVRLNESRQSLGGVVQQAMLLSKDDLLLSTSLPNLSEPSNNTTHSTESTDSPNPSANPNLTPLQAPQIPSDNHTTASGCPIWVIKFSKDGSLLAAGCEDGSVRLWRMPCSRNVGDEKVRSRAPTNVSTYSALYTESRPSSPMSNDTRKSPTSPFQYPSRPPSGSSYHPSMSKSNSFKFRKALNSYFASHPAKLPSTLPNTPKLIFDSTPCAIFRSHTEAVIDLAFSPSAHFLLSASMDATIKIWHPVHSAFASSYKDPSRLSTAPLVTFHHPDVVTGTVVHPLDERYFVTTCLDGRVRVWSLAEKALKWWNQVPDGILTAVSITPDGTRVVVGTAGGDAVVFEWEGLKYHTQISVWGKGGLGVATSISGGSKITGIAIRAQASAPDLGVNPSTAFSSGMEDEKMLITSNDCRIRLYEFRDKSLLNKLKGPDIRGSQIRASFSSDGRYVVCGSEDKYVYLWPTPGTWDDSPQPHLHAEGGRRRLMQGLFGNLVNPGMAKIPHTKFLGSEEGAVTAAIFTPALALERLSTFYSQLPYSSSSSLQGKYVVVTSDIKGALRIYACEPFDSDANLPDEHSVGTVLQHQVTKNASLASSGASHQSSSSPASHSSFHIPSTSRHRPPTPKSMQSTSQSFGESQSKRKFLPQYALNDKVLSSMSSGKGTGKHSKSNHQVLQSKTFARSNNNYAATNATNPGLSRPQLPPHREKSYFAPQTLKKAALTASTFSPFDKPLPSPLLRSSSQRSLTATNAAAAEREKMALQASSGSLSSVSDKLRRSTRRLFHANSRPKSSPTSVNPHDNFG